ncbi:hypothetical protein K440DRAFT_631709 [Wilcoxina mikolae CBS 423.85]|nr:hypothetical protein K440DRAFT_631709 [Wilcoxina mikolae CBS 423.85]
MLLGCAARIGAWISGDRSSLPPAKKTTQMPWRQSNGQANKHPTPAPRPFFGSMILRR